MIGKNVLGVDFDLGPCSSTVMGSKKKIQQGDLRKGAPGRIKPGQGAA